MLERIGLDIDMSSTQLLTLKPRTVADALDNIMQVHSEHRRLCSLLAVSS